MRVMPHAAQVVVDRDVLVAALGKPKFVSTESDKVCALTREGRGGGGAQWREWRVVFACDSFVMILRGVAFDVSVCWIALPPEARVVHQMHYEITKF